MANSQPNHAYHQLRRQTDPEQYHRQGYVLPHLRLGWDHHTEYHRPKCDQRHCGIHIVSQTVARHGASPRVAQRKPTILFNSYLLHDKVVILRYRYQWSLIKSLEYLNSRREGSEVDEVFMHQLNTLHNKLQDRGLIKSKQWILTPNMAEEEILITNTFLNSRKKGPLDIQKSNKKKKNNKNINWKDSISVEHVYSSNTIISQLNQSRVHQV